MNRQDLKKWFGLALVAGMLFVVALACFSYSRTSPAAPMVAAPLAGRPIVSSIPRVPAPFNFAVAQQPPVRLIDTLFSAPDGAAFVALATKHPEEGGMYYAKQMLKKCKIEAELAGTGISNAEAIEAHARGITLTSRRPPLPGLCKNFDASSLDGAKVEQLESQGIAENDTLLAAIAALRHARAMRSYMGTQKALQRLLALANPVFLQADGVELLRQKTGVLWFHSRSYDFDDETLLNAMHLVPCDFGLPCGANHTMVARHCRITQRCYASLEELIAREGIGAVEGGFGHTQLLRQNIALAIKSKDTAAFLPPKAEFEEDIPRKYVGEKPNGAR